MNLHILKVLLSTSSEASFATSAYPSNINIQHFGFVFKDVVQQYWKFSNCLPNIFWESMILLFHVFVCPSSSSISAAQVEFYKEFPSASELRYDRFLSDRYVTVCSLSTFCSSYYGLHLCINLYEIFEYVSCFSISF